MRERERELKVHSKVWENFPCIPVIQECPWNKTEIKKKQQWAWQRIW